MKILFVLLALSFGSVLAQASPSSESFRRSCNISYESYQFVEADCRAVDGSYHYNNFDKSNCIGDISNTNGYIVCERSRSRRGSRDDRGGYDQGGRGGYDRGGYDRGGYDGGGYDRGRDDRGRGGFNLPSGSYLKSCQSCTADSEVVSCSCTNSHGNAFFSSLYYRQCRTVGNNEGHLVCE